MNQLNAPKKKKLPEKKYNVQPLRTPEELDRMKWALHRYTSPRDVYMFTFGVNTGLRISDILPLKVKDVRNQSHVPVIQKKNSKYRSVKISHFKHITDDYIQDMNDNDFLFPSRRGNSHISTTQAYRVLVKAAEMVDMDFVGTHSMRKAFGYHHYKRNKDTAALQEIFSHSSPDITKRYIGITQEELDDTIDYVL